MQTLIQSKVKQKMVSFYNSTYKVKEKSNYSKLSLDLKLYQKLFVIIFLFSLFLIFPESPKDSEEVCRTYHSIEACNIW